MNPIPNSWDYFFLKREAAFVMIHLKSGKLIGGVYGGQSYASAYPEPRDLYLKEVWKIEKGYFKHKIKDTKGLYITYDEILYIEFFDAN